MVTKELNTPLKIKREMHQITEEKKMTSPICNCLLQQHKTSWHTHCLFSGLYFFQLVILALWLKTWMKPVHKYTHTCTWFLCQWTAPYTSMWSLEDKDRGMSARETLRPLLSLFRTIHKTNSLGDNINPKGLKSLACQVRETVAWRVKTILRKRKVDSWPFFYCPDI